MWMKWLIFCIGLVIAGGSAGLYGHGWYRLHAADAWEEVGGKILASSYEIHESTDSHDDRITSYRPLIHYQYTVEGREYRGRSIQLSTDGSFSEEFDAKEFVADFPAGATVPVYYDPSDPGDAALMIEQPEHALLIGVALGVIFMLTGIYLPRSLL